jgi:phthalate 4,5-cis-dihydrodiol dehydrogenase
MESQSAESGKPILRVGIAGLGFASTIMLPELAAHPRIKITAGADVRPESVEPFGRAFGAETYSSVEALCASKHVDAVYVLTPNRFHAEHAIRAAEHGKHVFADKPMALTLEDCDRMIDAAERNGVRILVGHTQSLDPGIRAMAEIVRSGELGAPMMFHTWYYNDWLYRPRDPDELDATNGEGIVYRQAPVQVDILRMLGGGRVRGVRAQTRVADLNRPVVGACTAFLEFEDGTPATMVYGAYGHFDVSELSYGLGAQIYSPGNVRDPAANLAARRRIKGFASRDEELAYKNSTRFGGSRAAKAGPIPKPGEARQNFFGLTIASCEHGDIRQTPTGLIVYGDDEVREIPVSLGEGQPHRYTWSELDLMLEALDNDRQLFSHDGHWGKATLEVCLGIDQSARDRREVQMQHQSSYPSEVRA